MRLTDIDVLLKQWCENVCSSKFCIGEKCSEYKTLENATIIDAVPVIRCKDCKYSLPNDGKLNEGARYCSCIYGGAKKEHPAVWDMDYCSGGKKKVQE